MAGLVEKSKLRRLAVIKNGKKYIPYEKAMSIAEIPIDNLMSIDWLNKELYELMYERRVGESEIKIFHELIKRWRDEHK